jgi:hypothetical protein
MNVYGGLVGEGEQWEIRGGKEKILRGEEDESVLHIYI